MNTLKEALIVAVKEGGYIAKYADNDYRVFGTGYKVGELDDGIWVDFEGKGVQIPSNLGVYGEIDYLDDEYHDDGCMCEDCFEAYLMCIECLIEKGEQI